MDKNEIKQKALDFLREHHDVAFATVENGKPRIRVFQVMRMNEDTLWFATSPKKQVYKQLMENPAVELLGMSGEISVRVVGEVHIEEDDAIQLDIYNNNEVLRRLYADYKAMAYFAMPINSLDYFDLRPTPPLLVTINFKD